MPFTQLSPGQPADSVYSTSIKYWLFHLLCFRRGQERSGWYGRRPLSFIWSSWPVDLTLSSIFGEKYYWGLREVNSGDIGSSQSKVQSRPTLLPQLVPPQSSLRVRSTEKFMQHFAWAWLPALVFFILQFRVDYIHFSSLIFFICKPYFAWHYLSVT